MEQELVVWDGDDTLWFVEPLYDEARAEAGRVVASVGLDAIKWDVLERSIDVQNVARFGLAATRFPTSCVEAYRVLTCEVGRTPDAAVEGLIWTAADGVFRRPAPPADHVRDVLSSVQHRYRLQLLTKGDESVQRERIRDSGLEHFFERIWVVSDKDRRTFRTLLDAAAVPASRAWSVGNSLPSDINPALACGMSAIWVDADVWEHERRDLDPLNGHLVVAQNLVEAGQSLLAHAGVSAV